MFRIRTLSRAAALFCALAACSDSTVGGTGTLTLLLTDAPGDVKKAVVTIDQIYLQPTEEDDGARIVLRDEDFTVDLLTLADATEEIVSDVEIPARSYEQLRFVISGAYIEVENAEGGVDIYASSPDYAALPAGATVTGTLIMPSFAQTGLKVVLPNDQVVIAGDKVVLVDFDVSQSFGQQAGMSGLWVMTPVITASEVPPEE